MGKLKSSKKCTICYIITIIILLALTIGFFVAFLVERNKTKDDDNESSVETTTPSPTSTPTPTDDPNLLLPNAVKPTHYELMVEPDHEPDRFNGTVSISLKVDVATNVIKIHSYKLEVKVDKLVDSNNDKLTVKSVVYDENRQYHTIQLDRQLAKDGQYIITMSFSGSLVGKLIGFHKSNYTDSNNQKRQFYATKFEPTYARQAFPCFDEPNFKATYSISIIHDKKLTAISNGQQIEKLSYDSNKYKTVFNKTVKMSTYLVAYVISDFKHTKSSTQRGKQVRVFSQPEQLENTKYALDTAINILEYYEKYFQIDYPMEKLDLVALPVFVSGAMENWGIITFREDRLLYDTTKSSTQDQKSVAAVIGHELAHMWFGNLVTMKWWDDLWLNEGFASYIEYRGVNDTHPDWHINDFFLTDDLHGVMRTDALDSSHPIIQSVTNPDQITEIFDSISYNKGSAVLRMLEHSIGTDIFREGVIEYIKLNIYDNAKTQNLWDAIQTVVDKKPGLITSVTDFMNKWTTVKGYPVISVKRLSPKLLELKQQTFLLDSNKQKLKIKDEANPWQIYVTYSSGDGISSSLLMKQNEQNITLDREISIESWIKLNDQQYGYYIVNYDERDWKMLATLLKNNREALSPTNRANLIFDASMLAESGIITYDLFLDLISYIRNEDSLIPWTVANSALSRLKSKLSSTVGGLSIKQYMKESTEKIYSSLGWQSNVRNNEQNFQQKLLRRQIISLSCSSGNQECLAEASNLFHDFLNNGQQIAADIREYGYKYGLQQSNNHEDWDQVFSLWRTETIASERSKLLSALTNVENGQSLSKLIAYSNDSSNDQDFFAIQQSIAANSVGQQLVWNYMRENWEYLVSRFKLNDRRLGTYILSVCSGFSTQIQLQEMYDFFAKYPEAGATQKAREQSIERVKNNLDWLKTYESHLVECIDNSTQLANPWLNWRLDDKVMPSAYKLNWDIDLISDTFSGTVQIVVDVNKSINKFILHSKGLNITKSEVYTGAVSGVKSNQLNKNSISFEYKPNDFYIIPIDSTRRPGVYSLLLEFNGNLSTGLYGLYKSLYTDTTNQQKKLATTQFQSTYARQAFPCFDEPQFKSTFEITVNHNKNYMALSNMPGQTTINGDKAVTKFDKSVKMVTYLVALVVSEFECITSNSDIRVQVCGAPGNKDKLDYAKIKTPEILKFYEKQYFDIQYPLPKLDNIAIPDFSAGAMENWGLVTYREVYLFYDEKESTTKDQMRICMIIAHELAHMWFGNLVTTKWWDDLWLNEGFATFMSYKAVGQVEKDWHYDDIFVLDELARVFEADSTPNTHPILASVQNADDISSVFDAITYGKGASILRMLESALGEDYFRSGIKNYLIKYKYTNTLTGELWEELTAANPEKRNVSQIMDTWVTRKGYPVVTISRDNTSAKKIKIKQELFLKDTKESKTDYVWKIPITYKAPADKNVYNEWLEDKERSLELKTSAKFIKFNVDQTGLYIVNYPSDDWKNWAKELSTETSDVRKKLSSVDKSELINDAFYLARSGRLDYNIALDLSKFLKYETSLIPWTTAQTMFAYIKTLIYTDTEIAFNYYINDLIGKHYKDFGWDDSVGDAQTRRLRTVVIDMACGYQLADCLKTASEKFAGWLLDQPIEPNLLSLVLKYGIRQSTDKSNFDFLKNKYMTSKSPQERLLYLQGLTSTVDIQLIKQLLDSALDETFVRKHDFFTFLTNIALNSRTGCLMVWDYFRDKYQEIEKRFTINNSNLGRIVYTISTQFTEQYQKEQVLELFKQYPNSGAGKLDREKALEVLDTNIKWIDSYKDIVTEWLTNFCPKEVCPWIVFRLNRDVVPKHYYLNLQVDTETNVFNGSVNIDVDIKNNKEIEYFIVHAANILNITATHVNTIDPKNSKLNGLDIKQTFRYSPLQFFVIQLKQKSREAKYQLTFEYNSNLELGGLSGLYRSFYESDGKTIGIAASQFQSTSARKAFPSFDEPSFRPTFDITIIHQNFNNVTITNMPIKDTPKVDYPMSGWTTTLYDRTKPMVTYLVAILVSNFACEKANPVPPLNYTIRVCSTPPKSYKLDYALKTTPKIFKSFEKLLEFPYQLPKSDLVAIPHFAAGAMENWGLVKFRESALLWTKDEDTSASQMGVASIIAHELAHMWFGNMLTCEFWGDLWLNEGFASYMEWPSTAYAEPKWHYNDLFVSTDMVGAIAADVTESSAPIVRKIDKPADMSYSSAIVYNKGSCIIRMMEFAMEERNFWNGIQKYLTDYQYSTVVTDNLWTALNTTFPDNLDVKSIHELMGNWVQKAGFPYINITRPDPQRPNVIEIKQQRFLANGQKPKEDTIWSIPVSYYANMTEKVSKLFVFKDKVHEQPITIEMPDLSVDNLIKFNVDNTGFYFVNYPIDDWTKWINALTKNTNNIINKLTPNDRAGFILDVFYLARANFIPLLKALDLTKYLLNEPHWSPWSVFNTMFSAENAINRLSMSPYKESMNLYLNRLTSKQYDRLGWDDSNGEMPDKRLRALIVDLSCRNDNQKCLLDAYREFSKWKNANNTIKLSPNLRSSVLKYGIRQSDNSSDFEFVFNKYIVTKDDMKSVYLSALTQSKDKILLKGLIDTALDDRKVPVSDFASLLENMASNTEGLPVVWDFFQTNYAMLSRKLSESQLISLFRSICDKFGDISHRSEIENLLKQYPNIGLSNNSRESGLNLIRQNHEWISQNSDTIGQWLASNACGDIVCPWSEFRLNPKVKPLNYELNIQINVTTNIYKGIVTIDVETEVPVLYFILHASSILNVTNSKAFAVSQSKTSRLQKELNIVKTFQYTPNDFWIIQLDKETEKGIYRLQYQYEGNLLLGGLSGLYRSKYINKNNETVGLASTQFEFTDARKAFPCFDEPSFKSTFEITIIHDKHMSTTLSNMPGKSSEADENGWVTTKFEKTPVPMVTYLVAMTVSDFVCSNDDKHIPKVGICAAHVWEHKHEFAMKSTKDCITYLAKEYTNISYPLPKVDMIAIPDFYYGAMENWGLVTFRETGLLWDINEDTSATKMSILAVIGHELAHFWFGNLVTCQWWSHFWLNEGFATFFEYKAVISSQPDWGYADLFVMRDLTAAVKADSSETSHPLVRTVDSAHDVQAYSSLIVYSKGSTVVRMLESVMGETNFKAGIRNYLNNNSYGNVITENLLDALKPSFPSELSVDIHTFMDVWTTKAGFPYINVTRVDNNKFKISQQRFLINGKTPENDTVWNIPLTYYKSFADKTSKLYFITKKDDEITVELDDSVKDLIKFNVDYKGMYFVNYPPEDWDKWIEALDNNENNLVDKLTPGDRANLLLDANYLSRANIISIVRNLQLAKYLKHEKHLTPWTIALDALNNIKKYMLTTIDYRQKFIDYLKELAKNIYNELEWDDNKGTDTEKRLRATIIDFVCGLYDDNCLTSALKEFTKWKNGLVDILRPNLKTSILRYAMRKSTDRSDWDFLWSKYINTNRPVIEKQTYLNALTFTTNPMLINTLLQRAVDSTDIKTSDIPTLIGNLGANWDALQITWEFFKQNHKKFASKLSTIQMGVVLNNICQQFANTTKKQEVENFFSSEQSLVGTSFDKNRALNSIQSNIDWLSANKQKIANFLECGLESCLWTTYRLNEKIVPKSYDLWFDIDLINSQFTGTATIDVDAQEDVNYFIVHAAKELNITSQKILLNGVVQEIDKTFRYLPYEFFVIQMKTKLNPDTYQLSFQFNSKLNENMDGLYRSQYYKDEKPIPLAATQFQATSARKAFPSFDEPSFKSTFKIKITSDKNMKTTISNEAQDGDAVIEGDKQTIKYKETPEMVTYLAALVVSDFECLEDNNNSYPVYVCASPVEKDLGKLDFSLKEAPQVLNYFETYLDSAYQLSKAHFIAIPDFSAGAMENWGLITFRETAMLWSPTESTSTNKMSVLATITHEIVHMWFGNLLTCKWWSDLWLNEAFASYLEYTAINKLKQDWSYNDLFLMTDTLPALSADSSATSHPIVRPVNSPEERAYTSAIVYNKGASVLRMLESVMESINWETALKSYLKKYEHKTVETKNLWDELQTKFPTNYKITVADLMDSWTTKSGFPYINVTHSDDNLIPNKLHIIQDRFLANGQKSDDDIVWTIPFTYYSQLSTNKRTIELIEDKELDIEISLETATDGLLKINTNSDGYYFVNYPQSDWQKWIKALTENQHNVTNTLTPSDRANFIIDSLYLSRAGLLTYLTPLELSKYLKQETHLTPWSVAISLFSPITRYLSSTDSKQDWQNYLVDLAKPTYDRLGWLDTGTHVEKRLRSSIIEFICANNYYDCLTNARLEYYKWTVDDKSVPPNILSPSLKYAIRNGVDLDWEEMWKTYKKETSTVLKLQYLNALAFTSNAELIKKLLELSMDDKNVRKQDYLSVLNYVITNPDGLQVMWDYYRTNYSQLTKRLSAAQLGTVLNNMCIYFNDDVRKQEVRDFLANNADVTVTQKERQRALETIDSNINWIQKNLKTVGEWLEKQTILRKGTQYINIWSKHKSKSL